jgi:metal-responsive CopG/Arc/MetJ family transcriptional regulator
MRDAIKISVTLPVKLVGAINEMQKQEMKSCSAIVSEAVRMYYAKKRMDLYRLDLSAAGKKAGILDIKGINKAVREVRTAVSGRKGKNYF